VANDGAGRCAPGYGFRLEEAGFAEKVISDLLTKANARLAVRPPVDAGEHAAVKMSGAVGHDLVVDPFGQLRRKYHAESIFAHLDRADSFPAGRPSSKIPAS
jgi:hypothetical protein